MPSTFSESWYRIASQRICLRPQARVHKQYFRGERWYVVYDPLNNHFFRLRPAAYDFVARLRLDRTVEEAWLEALEQNPEEAPGQEDALQLLAQLYHSNLLYYQLAPDSEKLFERYRKRREREIRGQLLNIMFVRIPLLDPDAFLARSLAVVGKLISPLGTLLWLMVVGYGLKLAVDHFPALYDQGQAVLAPGNLALLYLGFVLSKVLHEFGHAYVCRRYGGEVHVMGVMLLVFTPVPFVDGTSSWAFRSRWQRIFAASAGMLAEIFLAALAAIVWASTGPGLVHSLAYNIMFAASVATILFNANPLLRFDGYYVLSDLINIPNLSTRASQQLIYLTERYGFGYRKALKPSRLRREAIWLTLYGIASHLYRIVIFAGIILFVADKFLLLGLVLAVVCIVAWVFVPIGKFLYYLATSPRLERSRVRAIGVAASAASAVTALLLLVPFPNSFKAPGVIQADSHAYVMGRSPGLLRAVLTPGCRAVTKGQPLVQLEDRELGNSLEEALAQYRQAQAMERRALLDGQVNLNSAEDYRAAVEQRVDLLRQQRDDLTIRAELGGQWVAPRLTTLKGSYLHRGQPLGQILSPEAFYFSAAVSQKEVSRLFENQVQGTDVRLYGQAAQALGVERVEYIPAERQKLPSAALGWAGGGEVATDRTDSSGRQAAEPFFEVRAHIAPGAPVPLCHGRSGKIRFRLAPQPLFQQWSRKLSQVLQERLGW